MTGAISIDPHVVDELRALSGPGNDLLAHVVDIFLVQSRALIGEIDAAVAVGGHARAVSAARELENLSEMVGAVRLRQAAARICEADPSSFVEASWLVTDIEREWERVSAGLRGAAAM